VPLVRHRKAGMLPATIRVDKPAGRCQHIQGWNSDSQSLLTGLEARHDLAPGERSEPGGKNQSWHHSSPGRAADPS
jgi:hypothetical protein